MNSERSVSDLVETVREVQIISGKCQLDMIRMAQIVIFPAAGWIAGSLFS